MQIPTAALAPPAEAPRSIVEGGPDRRDVLRFALLIAIAHGVNDAYASFVSPLVPRIMSDLGLSVSLGTTVAIVFSLSSSLLQPVLGWGADRFGRKPFLVLGPLVCGVFVSAIGFSSSLAGLLALLTIAGIGSAAFHPAGASMAARVEQGRGRGIRLSVFSFGGAVGFAAGPLIGVALVQRGGLPGLWVAVFPAIIMAAVTLAFVPAHGTAGGEAGVRPPRLGLGEVLRARGMLLALLFGISAVGAFLQRTFITFHPMIVAGAGGSESMGAVSISVYLGATGLGTLFGGWLTDRVRRGTLLLVLTFLAVPAHALALALAPGSAGALAAAAAAGFLSMAILPPIVVTAQESLPSGAGTTSGIVMGLAWGAGSLAVLLAGLGGDVAGPRAAALWATPIGLLACVLAVQKPIRRMGTSAHRAG